MMMVGHTHEDIDAMFRHIADKLRARGVVRTVDELVVSAREAYSHIIVEQMVWVPDYSTWLRSSRGDFDHFKEHRYFVITRRSLDGVVAMWSKPDSSHIHLYPTKKDPATGMPLYTVSPEGQKLYTTCEEGIEILVAAPARTGAIPPPQAFEESRLDTKDILDKFETLCDLHPNQFEEVRTWWQQWGQSTCLQVHEAVMQHPKGFVWPEKCRHFVAPSLDGLRQEYAEAIRYRNAIGNASFTMRDRDQAREECAKPSPELHRGDLLCLKSPESDDAADGTPFWMAEVAVDYVPPTDETIADVWWYACFKSGKAQRNANGSWKPVCIGYQAGLGGVKKYHAYTAQCQRGGHDIPGHGRNHSSANRSEVVLYHASLTPSSRNLSTESKHELWKLREVLTSNGGVPQSFASKKSTRQALHAAHGD